MTLTRRQLLAANGGRDGAPSVERLLAFETRLEAAYRAALARGAIEPALGRLLLAHEREHVRGVEIALARLGRRSPAPRETPPDRAATSSRRAFARFALDLERAAVDAYAEVLPALDAPGLRQPLGSIMAAGAQHEVALRQVLGGPLLEGGVP